MDERVFGIVWFNINLKIKNSEKKIFEFLENTNASGGEQVNAFSVPVRINKSIYDINVNNLQIFILFFLFQERRVLHVVSADILTFCLTIKCKTTYAKQCRLM